MRLWKLNYLLVTLCKIKYTRLAGTYFNLARTIIKRVAQRLAQ